MRKHYPFLFFIFVLLLINIPDSLYSKIIAYRNEKGVLVLTNKPSRKKPIRRIYKISNYNAYANIIDKISKKYNVPSTLIHQIILVESNYNPNAVSSKGAIGLMQLMPETAKQYGVKDPFDPVQNIEGGVKYLKDLIKLFKGNTDLILAAYNAGQEAVKKYGGIPPYPETRRYIEKIKMGYESNYITVKKLRIYRYRDLEGRLVISNKPPLPGKYKGKIEVLK
ncbi:lytic transglycosylase domain-containing protein [Candidatus Aminicenantes bacterium AC-335-A11]|jgi:soluble lytic murein transglycosylase-like protein|nr:lytic transglycosylase domain-containing protein [SCandidatus Aminicenantes bacterium Aminicenantia_JdfR_composite]MCP2597618.1 lytic transglycosylase domain-containing protein [Candidatus Aminicenantes bacterium AC-335-G13]MCP2598012.1 lytic transglycosylase domain-containing protein [Candidatus Aminicenantes bacterium AC-335-L06]MCP2606161.1 lytic transglycosylase domain-containing protein [Candidatus Aminicenantes bacterium AC-708-I09]MCP2618804.1 lytic transglycosylase domain-containing 